MSSLLDQSEAFHAELTVRLERARAALAKNQSQRRDLAFARESGDEAARKMTAVLAKEAAALADDISSLEAAVEEAERRVQRQLAIERDVTERDKAKQALALIEAFRKRGAALDEAFARALGEFEALERDRKSLDLLGYGPATASLIKVNMATAANAALQRVGLQQTFLPPGRRHTFAEVISGWSESVARRAQSRLDAPEPTTTSKKAERAA